MHVTFSFDPVQFLGIAVLGVLASYVGNVVGLILAAILGGRNSNQKSWGFIVGFVSMAHFTPVKIVIALIASVATSAICATTGVATVWTMGICAGIGFLFSAIVSRSIEV